MAERALSGGRALDRLVNFTDAVVAVAITLMVLPLVDLDKVRGEGIGGLISAHAAQLTTFLFTFFLVSVMWLAHNRILNRISGYDGTVFWLNTLWLVGIVLLPLATSLPHEVTPSNGAWVAYWILLAFITLVGGVMSWHIDRHPDMSSTTRRDASRGRMRSIAFLTVFVVLAVVSIWNPDLASYGALLLIPLTIWLRPARDDASGNDQLELSTATEEDA